MPDTMDEHVMALNEKLQALAAFEDAADIGATAQHLGHHEEGHSLQMRFAKDVFSVISVLRPRNPLLPHNGPRLDIIWDICYDHNLKAQAQAKRGNPGVTTIVEGSTPVPRDWNKFLANSRNKVQLFRFLSKAVIETSSQFTDVVVCSTYDDHVLVNSSDSQSVADFDTIMSCNHQEADSRIFLHLSHAAQQGQSKAFICTVDSDVVIICCWTFWQPGSDGVVDRHWNWKSLPTHPSS